MTGSPIQLRSDFFFFFFFLYWGSNPGSWATELCPQPGTILLETWQILRSRGHGKRVSEGVGQLLEVRVLVIMDH